MTLRPAPGRLARGLHLLPRHGSFLLAAAATVGAGLAQTQTNFSDPLEVSVELPGGVAPGGSAAKAKVSRLVKTPGGAHDGRLVAVFADANHTDPIWEPRDGERLPRDIFATFSDDEGRTWSAPVNISRTARTSSATADWDGDGVDEIYWGDSEKPNLFAAGDVLMVSWIDSYMPEPGWVFGDVGVSAAQGRVSYTDDKTLLVQEVPFRGVYAAVSYNGGQTWQYGDQQPPIQLTFGERDAKQDVCRGAGRRWLITWQEDPEGLKLGEGAGPGDGGSGAVANTGTDIWYTWAADVVAAPLDLRTNRGPLTNHSEYDLSAPNALAPLVGKPGVVENHAATRANLNVVQVGTTWTALVAYEETKGESGVLFGKTIQYHAFPFDQPVRNGAVTQTSGDAGTALTDIALNSRRVRFARQTPNGVDPALFIFWREGLENEGGPADIRGKVSVSFDATLVAASPTLNFSTHTPTAGAADLLLGTQVDALEDANAHRAIMRGGFIALGWCYTPDGLLARMTDQANYNFYVRRSFDGGASWDTPRNVSGLSDTRLTVREPRLVQAPQTGMQNDDVFVAAWGTVTNAIEGMTVSEALDVNFTRTADRGATWEKVVYVGGYEDDPEYESQLQIDDAGLTVYFVQQAARNGLTDAMFSRGVVETFPATLGTIYCIGDGTGVACPCGNLSDRDTGEGCLNSTGHGGLLLASGSLSLAANDLRLDVTNTPVPGFALLVHGTASANGTVGLPLRDGLLCVGGTLRRLAIAPVDALGAAYFEVNVLGMAGTAAGETAHFQVIYRDFGTCAPSASGNSTNALRMLVQP